MAADGPCAGCRAPRFECDAKARVQDAGWVQWDAGGGGRDRERAGTAGELPCSGLAGAVLVSLLRDERSSPARIKARIRTRGERERERWAHNCRVSYSVSASQHATPLPSSHRHHTADLCKVAATSLEIHRVYYHYYRLGKLQMTGWSVLWTFVASCTLKLTYFKELRKTKGKQKHRKLLWCYAKNSSQLWLPSA